MRRGSADFVQSLRRRMVRMMRRRLLLLLLLRLLRLRRGGRVKQTLLLLLLLLLRRWNGVIDFDAATPMDGRLLLLFSLLLVLTS